MSEKLTIWPMPNRFNLLHFQYDFSIPLVQSNFVTVDKFPRQILDLMRETGNDVRRIEANLVQGRWQYSLMPQVMGYQDEANDVVLTRVLQSS